MLSSQYPDHSPNDFPERGTLEELIARTRQLRDQVEAIRREEPLEGARHQMRHTRWNAALDQLDGLDEQLDQLRGALATPRRARLGERIGSAEWSLLTDGVIWSDELFTIFGRPAADGPPTLDELPSCLVPEDQPGLASAITGCLIDGRPVDSEFRVRRPDGSPRTVRMIGEPEVDDSGGTIALWAVIHDVSEVRLTEDTGGPTATVPVTESRHERQIARDRHQLSVELQESVLAPWLETPDPTHANGAAGSLELAGRYLPARSGTLLGGKWYDTLCLPDGSTVLSVGDLSGRGSAAAAGSAAAIGATRGISLMGAAPGSLLRHLNQLLDSGVHPVLASAVCCRYRPDDGLLTWAQAGHPAPLLCRRGTGHALRRPAGALLGAVTEAAYDQRTERLEPGDLLVLHTDGLFPQRTAAELGGAADHTGDTGLLGLVPRLAASGSARECLRLIIDACDHADREDDACVLVARVHTADDVTPRE